MHQNYNETVTDYTRRTELLKYLLIENLCRDKDNSEKKNINKIISDQTLTNYIEGFRHPLKMYIKARTYETFEDCSQKALEEERILNHNKNKINNFSDKNNRSFKNNYSYDGQNPHKNIIKCQICQKIGHSAAMCRNKQRVMYQYETTPPDQFTNIVCRYCKKIGHDIQKCRKRMQANERNKFQNDYKTNNNFKSNPRNATRTNITGQPAIHSLTADNKAASTTLADNTTLPTVANIYCLNTYQVSLTDNHVRLKCHNSKRGYLDLMVDTGSDVNIIKVNHLYSNIHFDDKQIISLSGIGASTINTLGTIRLHLENHPEPTIFHIVPKDFPIPSEGIIGKSFLKQNKSIIDFGKNRMLVTPSNENDSQCNSNENFNFTLAPRTETIVSMKVNQINCNFIVEKSNVREALVGNTLTTPCSKGIIKFPILNPSEHSVKLNNNDLSNIKVSLFEDNIDQTAVCNSNISEQIFSIYSPQQRVELISNVKTDHLNREEKQLILDLCKEYSDIFHFPGEPLSCTTAVQHSIRTPPDSPPINVPPYRLPQAQQAEIQRQVDKMEKENIIVKSMSPYNAPLLVVPKNDSSNEKRFRVVTDFRKLNDLTIGDAFSLPNINQILDSLGNAKYFTTLDLILSSNSHEPR